LKLRLNQWNDTLKVHNKPGNGIIRFNKSMLTGIKFGIGINVKHSHKQQIQIFSKYYEQQGKQQIASKGYRNFPEIT
jgi:hypothetical protein